MEVPEPEAPMAHAHYDPSQDLAKPSSVSSDHHSLLVACQYVLLGHTRYDVGNDHPRSSF